MLRGRISSSNFVFAQFLLCSTAPPPHFQAHIPKLFRNSALPLAAPSQGRRPNHKMRSKRHQKAIRTFGQDEAKRALLSLLSTVWFLKDCRITSRRHLHFICSGCALRCCELHDLFEVAKYIESGRLRQHGGGPKAGTATVQSYFPGHRGEMASKHDGFPARFEQVPASKETLGGRQMSKEQLTALVVLLALRVSDGIGFLDSSGSHSRSGRVMLRAVHPEDERRWSRQKLGFCQAVSSLRKAHPGAGCETGQTRHNQSQTHHNQVKSKIL